MLGKVVIITGASSGIGRALARECFSRGAKLSLGARRIEQLQSLKSELQNPDILCTRADVSLESDCANLINRTLEEFGQIDILINNAGISMRALFNEMDLEVMHRVMDVNFYGTVYCTKFALPHLLASKGSLVGIISIAGYLGLPGRSAYVASKFAIRGFLDTIRIEHLKSGLHVLVAAPGFTASEVRKVALTADGTPQRETPRVEESMMSAETCAYAIAEAIRKRKRALILTFIEGKFSVFLGKFLPSLLDRLTYNHMAKEPDSPLIS
ncbi:MAG: SDR family oxidoreductase [Mariniphaga sp.]